MDELKWYGRVVVDSPQDAEILFTTDDSQAFVNYLHVIREAEVEDDDYASETIKHRSLIERGLRENTDQPHELAKYQWMSSYHDYFCGTYYAHHPEFRLGTADPEGFVAFRNFVKGVGDR